MTVMITLESIKLATSNLSYRKRKAHKHKLVHAILEFYPDADAAASVQSIPEETLIGVLWNTGNDPVRISKKRKNLSSVRSSVNADLKRLYQSGDNPDGIVISSKNIFVMSDEAKDRTLKSFLSKIPGDSPASLDEINKILNIVEEILADPEGIQVDSATDRLKQLGLLKNSIQRLTERVDLKVTVDGRMERGKVSAAIDAAAADGGGADAATSAPGSGLPDDRLGNGDSAEVSGSEGAGSGAANVDIPVDDTIELVEDEVDDELEEIELLDEIDDDAATNGIDTEHIHVQGNVDAPENSALSDSTDNDDGQGLLDENSGRPNNAEKARLLAEEFNRSLASMDKFYNQYLLISGGTYIVGSQLPFRNESVGRTVALPSFYIGKYPVTNALFEVFIEKTAYRTTAEKLGYGTVHTGRYQRIVDTHSGRENLVWNAARISKKVEGAFWYQPSGPGSSIHKKRNHPVVQISFEDAMAFAAWTGKRLPTEEEWEAAARTADGRLYPWGNEWRNDACNIESSCIADTTPVDNYRAHANDLGIIDTLGNILEWTASTVPCTSKNRLPPIYIAKGGSWVSSNEIRLPARFEAERGSHSNLMGFRCVAC